MKRSFFVAMLAVFLSACGVDYGDGSRVGVVQKISHKGLIWKTYEGELVMDGFRMKQKQGNASGGNVWTFSAASKSVADEIDRTASLGHPVKLTYVEKLFNPPWVGGTSYMVVKVEPAQNIQ